MDSQIKVNARGRCNVDGRVCLCEAGDVDLDVTHAEKQEMPKLEVPQRHGILQSICVLVCFLMLSYSRLW